MRVETKGSDANLLLRGISVSHPERLVCENPIITKGDIARYYDRIADRIMPHLCDRVLTFLRFPDGISSGGFFQKHKGAGFPDAIHTVPEDGEEVMKIDGASGLIAAAQMNTIEFHIRNARLDRPDIPDRMVFDLDPDTSVDFGEVKAAAVTLRDRLAELDLPSHPMVTGGKGVHVTVPLRRSAEMETVTLFAKSFARLLAAKEQSRFTAELSKKARKGRIIVDWLRNQRESTAICPWSLRERQGAGVAMLVTWDELARLTSASNFGITAAMARKEPPLPKPVTLTPRMVERLNRLTG